MKYLALFACAGLCMVGCQSDAEVSDADARVGIPQNYQPEKWPPIADLNDDLLIKHYFEVKEQRIRQAELIKGWEDADGHPENFTWHKAYYDDTAGRERVLKSEMQRRKLSYNLKRK